MKRILFLAMIIIIFSRCSVGYPGVRYSRCPTNNKSFFYNRMGVMPSKQFLKWGN